MFEKLRRLAPRACTASRSGMSLPTPTSTCPKLKTVTMLQWTEVRDAHWGPDPEKKNSNN
ncbi:hypothetical protein DPMN_002243 [Dreissena polymorpha]|uniref:Uncharacterized protein n=1 Tax=Dreissena polymorpha TaxID=45954 RepID=A0A9D4RRK4_DREPO|nr:hypothetical protein DPMN_002243 [Dreissena polymorpha]